jgi:hypothetical protein
MTSMTMRIDDNDDNDIYRSDVLVIMLLIMNREDNKDNDMMMIH